MATPGEGQPSGDAGRPPGITVPKGGGAVRGLGETFDVNPATGTGSVVVPVTTSAARDGFGPTLALRYDSAAGNGLFGLGWGVGLPAITRRTDHRVPEYQDGRDSDVFLLSGAEDLVPVRERASRKIGAVTWTVERYRPRVEGLFARIERWTAGADVHWRTIDRDNVTALYGTTADERIAGPDGQIFSWLIASSRDAKGNTIRYGYKAERNNRYPKWIRYGDTPVGPRMFEVVFDYGEHDDDAPTPAAVQPWRDRADPFSSYRAGFEIRTERLCRRILGFHHVPDDPAVGADCLVRSIELGYRPDPAGTMLTTVTQAGFRPDTAGGYLRREVPPLTFGYTEPHLDDTVHTADAPHVDGALHRWADLHGEGLPSVLTELAGGWYLRRNLGGGRFGAAEPVRDKPATARFGRGTQLLDLAGDGRPDLVDFSGPAPGFAERDDDGEGWGPYVPFASLPTLNWSDPNLRFADLDGDGRADVLVTGGDHLTWYPSLGEAGFEGPRRELGPGMVFADGEGCVFLADFSGDGLTDFVRVRNGAVSYRPSLGHGRFGAEVAMRNPPRFEASDDLFDPRRLRLADVDGRGPTDLVYLRADGVHWYANQSGNGWADGHRVASLPPVDDLAAVTVTDLLGEGTACLVWSSPLAGYTRQPLRYVDLMGGKPYLLATIDNNRGARTTLTYAPSTRFSLADRAAGRPWLTTLPFPVQLVERVEVSDRITGNTFVTRYSYRHGRYDGVEREFCGFGMVEKHDTDSYAGEGDVAPTMTRTWYHTGAYLAERGVSRHFAHEYHADPATTPLGDSILPEGLNADEVRQACRALKGSVLREEVYGLDGGPAQQHPYTVAEHNYAVVRLQPARPGGDGVFLVHPAETVDHAYERAPTGARVRHEAALDVDDYGNVVVGVSVAYGRRADDPALPEPVREAQRTTLLTVSEHRYTRAIDEDDAHRTPMTARSETAELTGVAPPANGDRYTMDELRAARGAVQKRTLGATRTEYWRDDLSGALPDGEAGVRGLPLTTYRMMLTDDQAAVVGPEATAAMLAEAGYRRVPGEAGWWASGGEVHYDAAAFYLPNRYVDEFGNPTLVGHDRHQLLIAEVRDATGSTTSAEHDYRTLQPAVVVDANRNRALVLYDALGLVVATAVQGKTTEHKGDTLTGVDPDPSPAVLAAYFAAPLANPASLLGEATMRTVYDLSVSPVVAATLSRETHRADSPTTRIGQAFAYSDGFGRVVQQKSRAEPASPGGPPRWVGTGWTIFNNKGLPVRRYEPYFSATHHYEPARADGVSPLLCYDPMGRQVATLRPDHTYDKTIFFPWRQEHWDANDTVLVADPATDPDVGAQFRRLPPAQYLPTWYARRTLANVGADERRAAQQTADHGETPLAGYLDPLGRTVYAVGHNRVRRNGTLTDRWHPTRMELDVEGRQLALYDTRIELEGERIVASTTYDLAGRAVRHRSMEAGERRLLPDADGKPVLERDSRGHLRYTRYDELRRPLEVRVGSALVERITYGETRADALDKNLRGRVHQVEDGAGVLTDERYDFKGNLERSGRRLATGYSRQLDWSGAVPLETATRWTTVTYDAVNRPRTTTTPDGTVITTAYNEAGLPELVTAGPTTVVQRVAYDPKGRRTLLVLGNGAQTTYGYDPETFRLRTLRTGQVQDLSYVYDPAGNVTHVGDAAQHPVYRNNVRVTADADYVYDALYRLVEATGREHLGWDAAGNPRAPAPPIGLPQIRDGDGVGRYVESYDYDLAGNLSGLVHLGSDPADPGWTRAWTYAEASPLDGRHSNRLSGTRTGGGAAEPVGHDPHGNIVRLPHLPELRWDHADRLSATTRQVVTSGTPEMTYYTYDAAGQRVQKVTDRQAAPGQNATRRNRRVYLGLWEIYTEYGGNGTTPGVQRETVHVMLGEQRVALIERRTGTDDGSPVRAVRYQLGDHLGSVSLELGEAAEVVSYEEYYPYGATAYQATPKRTTPPKRYRYTAKERDEESGLDSFGARYYAPWLGRWTSCDPSGAADSPNLYLFVGAAPTCHVDPDGRLSDPSGLFLQAVRVVLPGAAEGAAAAGGAAGGGATAAGGTAAVAGGPVIVGIAVVLAVAITGVLLYRLHEANKELDAARKRAEQAKEMLDRQLDSMFRNGQITYEQYLLYRNTGSLPGVTGPAEDDDHHATATPAATPAAKPDAKPEAKPDAKAKAKPQTAKKSTAKANKRAFNATTRAKMGRLIARTPGHILAPLVDPVTEKFYSGVMGEWDKPSIQMGHATSLHSGAAEKLFIEDTEFNQIASNTAESKGISIERPGVDLGGIPVEMRTARLLERIYDWPKGTVDAAPPSTGWDPKNPPPIPKKPKKPAK
ncbi:SpvB/TcaC N-terminal domain-containing protein [Paractinoplanes globisporus]|uniref:SpvB/TcaC N-terminal domain-containing protein n=1 Tax=Paractinoplanes globisporus TaxID=113565 RepID=A0ABW6WVU6_9ACTN|nr:SpvB/TcaC N-terminal domain-containing protein [Actinoplanes globisporus]